MDAPKCAACEETMTEGHIPDYAHRGASLRQEWVVGPSEPPSLRQWLMPSVKKRFLVEAYRCPKCGRLELFALKRVY
jgi:hypothetical protein